jgi:hypothetical protein
MSPEQIADLAVDAVAEFDRIRPLPPAFRWLRDGLRAMLFGQDLRVALGIKATHGKPAEAGVEKALRDKNLRELAFEIDPNRCDRTATAERVAAMVAGVAPVPVGLEEIVLKIRASRPVGPRQIARILENEPTQGSGSETINQLVCLWEGRR